MNNSTEVPRTSINFSQNYSISKSRKRKAHKKSRNGCIHCKHLRIKCDEGAPECENCIRRGRQCIYSMNRGQEEGHDQANSPLIIQETFSKDAPNQQTSNQDSYNQAPAFSGGYIDQVRKSSPPSVDVVVPSPLSLQLQSHTTVSSDFCLSTRDMELIHHYTMIVPELMMAPHLQSLDTWARHVPVLSFSNDMLCHGILGFSAMHLKRSLVDQTDVHRLGIYHYNRALMLSRRQVTKLNADNCEALFFTSCFIFLCSFALIDTIPLFSTNGQTDIFSIARGPYNIIVGMREYIKDRPIGIELSHKLNFDPAQNTFPLIDYLLEKLEYFNEIGMFEKSNQHAQYSYHPCDTTFPDIQPNSHLSNASSSSLSSSDSPHSASSTDESHSPFLKTGFGHAKNHTVKHSSSVPNQTPLKWQQDLSTVEVLKQSLLLLKRQCQRAIELDAAGPIIGWQMITSPQYVELLRNGEPFALIICGYFCAFLHFCNKFFWIADRPRKEVFAISAQLESPYKSLMEWPLKIIALEDLTLGDLLSFCQAPFDF